MCAELAPFLTKNLTPPPSNGVSFLSILFNLELLARKTWEGWPLLTVETEVNGDSKCTNEGPSLVGSLGLPCRYKRFLFCLGCSSRPSVKYFFFLTIHYFNSFVPIAQQAGQAAVLGRLSLSMCLWSALAYTLEPSKRKASQMWRYVLTGSVSTNTHRNQFRENIVGSTPCVSVNKINN